MRNKKIVNLRVAWILLQGMFLPMVYFMGKLEDIYLAVVLFVLYEALVVGDAILTCRLFEPKEKAK